MGNLWTFGLVVSHLSHPVCLILSHSCQLYLYPDFPALKDLNHTHILKEGTVVSAKYLEYLMNNCSTADKLFEEKFK